MIVVGVDGSGSARKALAWALAEARLRSDVLRVICAWDFAPTVYGAIGFVPPIDPEAVASFERAAEQTVAEMLEAEAEAAEGVHVQQSIVRGIASEVLVEAANGAALLVVGSRGHGSATGLLLGSVSMRCAHLAPCPVVIVRHDQNPARPSPADPARHEQS
jgi:nucleotide-binding universal stress UspA family protein